MWEKIDSDTHRMKVPGGWLIRSRYWMNGGCSVHTIFVPDNGWTWVLP